MKYNTIEIKPNIKKSWSVFFYSDDKDRERGPSFPHPLGFYHYPRYMQRERAFDKLKSFLCKKHREEIDRLKKSLSKLEKLPCPNAEDVIWRGDSAG